MGRIKYTLNEGDFEGVECTFRPATAKDVLLLKRDLPVLNAGRSADVASDQSAKIASALSHVQFADELIVRCAIAPKWIAESPPELVQGGPIPIEEVRGATRLELADMLAEAGGLGKDDEAALRPLSEGPSS